MNEEKLFLQPRFLCLFLLTTFLCRTSTSSDTHPHSLVEKPSGILLQNTLVSIPHSQQSEIMLWSGNLNLSAFPNCNCIQQNSFSEHINEFVGRISSPPLTENTEVHWFEWKFVLEFNKKFNFDCKTQMLLYYLCERIVQWELNFGCAGLKAQVLGQRDNQKDALQHL